MALTERPDRVWIVIIIIEEDAAKSGRKEKYEGFIEKNIWRRGSIRCIGSSISDGRCAEQCSSFGRCI